MPERRHHSHPVIQTRAREMRHDAPLAERLLWSRLRAGQLDGLKFRRQHPVDRFILDFFCPTARVAIELDGDSHAVKQAYDRERTSKLEGGDILVLRFLNWDLTKDLDAVCEEILRVCRERLDAVKKLN